MNNANHDQNKIVNNEDKIFVTLSHRHIVRAIHSQWSGNSLYLKEKVAINEAEEPDQIKWMDQKVSFCYKRFASILLIILCMILTLIVTASNLVLSMI